MTKMTPEFETLGTEPGLDFFPDTVRYDPALSEELLTEAEWAEREARAVREQETRDDLERERQGVNGNRINRFTKESDEAAMMQRGAGARMMDAAISGNLTPAQIYNTPLELQIGDENYQMSQGDLHQWALIGAERARESGDAEMLAFYESIAERTHANNGPLTDQDMADIARDIEDNPQARDAFEQHMGANSEEYESALVQYEQSSEQGFEVIAENSPHIENIQQANAWLGLDEESVGFSGYQSFASTVDGDASISAGFDLSNAFASALEEAGEGVIEPQQPDMKIDIAEISNNSGFNFS